MVSENHTDRIESTTTIPPHRGRIDEGGLMVLSAPPLQCGQIAVIELIERYPQGYFHHWIIDSRSRCTST